MLDKLAEKVQETAKKVTEMDKERVKTIVVLTTTFVVANVLTRVAIKVGRSINEAGGAK